MQIQIQRLQAAVADMREKLIWVWATKVSQVTRLAQNVWHTPLITLWTIGVKRWHWSWHWHCILRVSSEMSIYVILWYAFVSCTEYMIVCQQSPVLKGFTSLSLLAHIWHCGTPHTSRPKLVTFYQTLCWVSINLSTLPYRLTNTCMAIFEFQLVLPCWWWHDYDDRMVVVMALLQWICGLTRPQICALWRPCVGGSSAKKPQFLSTFFRNVQTINWWGYFEESAQNNNKKTPSLSK